MNTGAVICEYNPFHNGHKFQLEKIKKECDRVICVMSGSFVQRGDVAVVDKWTRAAMALNNGADLVIELPVCFSLNTAERFSFGAVSLIDSLGVCDSLYFGSESGNIDTLKNAASVLLNEPKEISDKIKKLMDSGISYPMAREEAFCNLIDKDLLSEPNNILALEYIKSLMAINSKIKPITIKREISHHHETTPQNNITSATAIRELIKNGEDFNSYIPENTINLYENFNRPDVENLSDILLYTIRTKSTEEISNINEVTEGLENRIKDAINYANTFDCICEFVKTKRYTMSKIRRILLSIILGLDKDLSKKPPEYLRVLGMNKKGMDILSQIKTKSSLPIITKVADFKENSESFKKDILSTDIFSLSTVNNNLFGKDFKTSPVIIK